MKTGLCGRLFGGLIVDLFGGIVCFGFCLFGFWEDKMKKMLCPV
jgi:hypothetical protein